MSERLSENEREALSKAVNEGLRRDSRIARDGVISRHAEALLAARVEAAKAETREEIAAEIEKHFKIGLKYHTPEGHAYRHCAEIARRPSGVAEER